MLVASELPARTLSRTSARSPRARELPVLSTTNRNARSRSCPAVSMIASSRVTSPRVVLSTPRRKPSSVCNNAANRLRRSAGSALSTIWPWRCRRSTIAAWSGASSTPLTTSPPAVTADQRKDAMAIPAPSPSGVAVDAAQNLLERRLAFDDREQPAVEDRPHAVFDRCTLDRRMIGAPENQLVDRRARHQQFTDCQAAAKAGATAFWAPNRTMEDNRSPLRQPLQPTPLDQRCRQRRGSGLGNFAFQAQPANQPLGQYRLEGGGQQIVFHPHVAQTRHGRCRRVGVHGGQHEMSG